MEKMHYMPKTKAWVGEGGRTSAKTLRWQSTDPGGGPLVVKSGWSSGYQSLQGVG